MAKKLPKVTVSLAVEPADFAAVDFLAKHGGFSRGAVMRQAIHWYINTMVTKAQKESSHAR